MPFWKREQLSPDEQASRMAVRAAQSVLKEAESAHAKAVKEAQKSLARARKDRDGAIKAATKRIAHASERKRLGTLVGVTLYEDWISTPQGESELSPDVTAVCDTAGNIERTSRVTATRLLTIGLFAFAAKKKKTHDDRELYLVVDAPGFVSAQAVNPDHGKTARQFAAQITTAARQAPAVIERKAAEVVEANTALERVTADMSAIDAAETELARVTADTAPIEQRRAELEQVTPAASVGGES